MQIGGIKHFIAPLCGRPIPKPGSTPVIVACVLEPQLRAVDWSESIGCATSSRNTSSKGLQKFLAREALGWECIRVFRALDQGYGRARPASATEHRRGACDSPAGHSAIRQSLGMLCRRAN